MSEVSSDEQRVERSYSWVNPRDYGDNGLAIETGDRWPGDGEILVPKSLFDKAIEEREQVWAINQDLASDAELIAAKREATRLCSELGQAREGLERIAEHDWTEPPTEMPDEMAREALANLSPKERDG